MYSFNGTPLNHFVKQALCYDLVTHEENTTKYDTRVQLLIDKEALEKSVGPELDQTTPERLLLSCFEEHFPERMGTLAEERKTKLSNRGQDLRDIYNRNNFSSEKDYLFPEAEKEGVIPVLLTSGKPATEMLGELGIARNKILYYKTEGEQNPDAECTALTNITSRREDIMPEYDRLIDETKQIELLGSPKRDDIGHGLDI